jgi:hypothetical protein
MPVTLFAALFALYTFLLFTIYINFIVKKYDNYAEGQMSLLISMA